MHCRELGVKDVWLCIDVSNNDCDVRDAEYAEVGKNKTRTNKPVVGFMYAISALDGLPITYSVFCGSRVDSRQIYLMVDYLKSYDIQISGVIPGRGFANIDCIRLNYWRYGKMCRGVQQKRIRSANFRGTGKKWIRATQRVTKTKQSLPQAAKTKP